jgi:hypothetical protein
MKSKTLTLSLSFVAVLALGCDQGGSSLDADELATECPSDFLAEYETEQLDESWDQLMLEAESYSVTVETAFDLTDVPSICLDYKAQYDADKAAMDESRALVEEAIAEAEEAIAEAKAAEEDAADDAALAAGATRVDRSTRWVTYEFAEGELVEGTYSIQPGWFNYTALRYTDSYGWTEQSLYVGRMSEDGSSFSPYSSAASSSWKISFRYPQ